MKTQTAIDHFGGREELAAALGISRTATYEWGKTVPLLRQCQIQVVTDGQLLAELPLPSKEQAA